jgi:hypothetical protein
MVYSDGMWKVPITWVLIAVAILMAVGVVQKASAAEPECQFIAQRFGYEYCIINRSPRRGQYDSSFSRTTVRIISRKTPSRARVPVRIHINPNQHARPQARIGTRVAERLSKRGVRRREALQQRIWMEKKEALRHTDS